VPHEKNLILIIEGCKRGEPESQRELYEMFYNYALKLCLRFTKDKGNVMEIINDGFVKVFRKIQGFISPVEADLATNYFKGWMKKIMVFTAIDHHRKEKDEFQFKELNDEMGHATPYSIHPVEDSTYEMLVEMIRSLPPSYRMVFNLYVIDGYSHKEICDLLKISESTSRSHLVKARELLRKMLKKTHEEVLSKSN
jgi:RNA polymerase sigma-70 factor (ECF subfamily)